MLLKLTLDLFPNLVLPINHHATFVTMQENLMATPAQKGALIRLHVQVEGVAFGTARLEAHVEISTGCRWEAAAGGRGARESTGGGSGAVGPPEKGKARLKKPGKTPILDGPLCAGPRTKGAGGAEGRCAREKCDSNEVRWSSKGKVTGKVMEKTVKI